MKAVREKREVAYKGTTIRHSADFSTETFQARRKQDDIFKISKKKTLSTRNSIPSKAVLQKGRRNRLSLANKS